MKSAPLCWVIQKGTNPLFRAFVQPLFDMKHEIAYVLFNNDSISLPLPQVLGQYLLGGPRHKPRELAQAYRLGSHGTENLCTLHLLWKRMPTEMSIAHVLGIQTVHIALSAALLSPNRMDFAKSYR
jgi:hypothetical protein